jgi:hypothetical protein
MLNGVFWCAGSVSNAALQRSHLKYYMIFITQSTCSVAFYLVTSMRKALKING